MKIRTIIIEDELPARKTLKSFLNRYFPQVEVIGEATTMEEGKALLIEANYDLVFIDIQLKDGTGLELLREVNLDKLRVIFTTAYDGHTLEAFKLKAFGYLLKPLDPIDFKEIVGRAIKDTYISTTESIQIKVPSKNGHAYLEAKNIIRCEAESNYTKISTVDSQTYLVSKSLKYFEAELGETFIRVHQSHLINTAYIDKTKIGTAHITLKNQEVIPVSRSRKEAVNSKLHKLL